MMERFKLYLDEGIVSSVAAFTFIKKLTTSFENWEEFKNGIIDKDGKIINRTKKIPIFNGIARKIKILFQRFVPNKKYLALLLTMYLLKKESVSDPLENLVKEELDQKLTLEEKVVLIDILTEITTSKDAGDYPKPFFVGKGLTDEEARALWRRRNKNGGRGFGYNSKTGYCRFRQLDI